MAWIESHDNLGEHPKVYALATSLNVEKYAAIGILHLLWHFTLKFSWMDGDLSKYSADVIARAVSWPGDPEKLLRALQSAGWLDDKVVHDWLDYAGRIVKDRIYNQQRRKTTLNGVNLRKSGATNLTNLTNQKTMSTPTSVVDAPTPPNPAENDKPDPKTPTTENLMALWNELAHPNLARVQILTPLRDRTAKCRLREHPEPEFWRTVIEKINASRLLRGEVPRSRGQPAWRCSFDWILNPTNLTKIVEGNYDEGRRN